MNKNIFKIKRCKWFVWTRTTAAEMIKKIKYVGILTLLISCNRGIWITQNAYRPKYPKFSILRKPFIPNEQINNGFLYLSKTKYISNSQGRIMFDFTGFYPDGRIAGTSLTDLELDKINQLNSWETATTIGYYTTEGDKIRFEYFLPGDGGHYETKEGIIKKDTIILNETFNLLFKKEVRSDTLIKSTFPLRR